MNPLKAFTNQQYMNVETYRKSGEGVRTPVWFVEFNGELCFTTEATSAKVKRIRRNASVKVAPCKVNGDMLGDWYPGIARFTSTEERPAIENIYSRKYGFQKFVFELFGRLRGKERVFMAIKLENT